MKRVWRGALAALLLACMTGPALAQPVSGQLTYQYNNVVNITTAATTSPKLKAGLLSAVTINTYVASATITIYDSKTATGTKLATITLPSTITALAPQTLLYNVQFTNGLTIVTSGATDITVSYR